ncbi:MAG: metallophosphoesterase [Syntrophobacterales bacterium]|jgi:UDP-2,3-diacylglucosamine pyrophosphatase LpxH
MKAIIISDLHLGARFSLSRHFENFLKALPEEWDLILNGDVVDKHGKSLTPSDQRILALIKKESFHRKVVWVRGNHDSHFLLEEPGKIDFKGMYRLGNQLLIAHGDVFDRLWGRNRVAVDTVRFMGNIWLGLGGQDVNLAQMVKRFKMFYKYYCKYLMQKAVRYARQHGFAAVTCGHTHNAEDRVFDGIRYINTGCWTEWPAYYLRVNGQEMTLNIAAGGE